MSPTSCTIRPAALPDVATIVDFNQRLAWETERRTLDADCLRAGVAAALGNAALARYFVATVADQPVGQVMVTYEWTDWRNGWFWWLQSVYVHADWRSRGVFRALFEHVRDTARALPDVRGLRLYVEEHNTAALATYGKLGMTPSGHLLYELDWSGLPAIPPSDA